MRRRLVRNTILVTVMVLVVLATPVVLLLRRATEDELRSRLVAQATTISTNLGDRLGTEAFAPTAAELIGLVPEGDRIEVRSATGVVIASYGPVIRDGFTAESSGPDHSTIEVATSGSDLRRRFASELVLLGVLAAGGVLLAAVLAAIFGARVSRPLEQLAASAARLGAGDFSAALPPASGIREIDDIRSTLSTSASRLDKTLSSERSFTGDATHQLRTGLTGIALQLQLLATHDDEAVRSDANHALAQTDRLTTTLDALLDLARGGRGSQRVTVQLHEIALEHRGDWLHRYQLARRGLLCHGIGSSVLATPGFIGQIIDILLDNALRHGRGDVRIDVSDRQMRVTDEGVISERAAEGLFSGSDDPAAPHGRGLALARRLAQADGGGLELISRAPTVFVLTLPAAHAGSAERADGA
ncbi:MAG: putative two-component histidine kinase [Ilumatobacteraceae bacterium]|nr:putative two-component histidine kinase [Ilumatobacteraceae bacterium]